MTNKYNKKINFKYKKINLNLIQFKLLKIIFYRLSNYYKIAQESKPRCKLLYLWKILSVFINKAINTIFNASGNLLTTLIVIKHYDISYPNT